MISTYESAPLWTVFADMNMTLAKYALCANIQNKLEAEEDESYYIYSF